MMRARNSRRPLGWISSLKNTPGERWSCDDDHALGAVDDEGALVGDQRQLAQVDLLLLDVADLQLCRSARSSSSLTTRRSLTFSGAQKVRPRSWHSSIPYFGSPSVVADVLHRRDVRGWIRWERSCWKTASSPSVPALLGLARRSGGNRGRTPAGRPAGWASSSSRLQLGEVDASGESCRSGIFCSQDHFLGRRDETTIAARRNTAPRMTTRARARDPRAGVAHAREPGARLLEVDDGADFLELGLDLLGLVLGDAFLDGFGALSTRSLASFRPRPVIARTTLMTWIFLSPTPVRMTSNSSFSSTAAAAPAAAATATGAAALTPNFSSMALTRSAASSRVMRLDHLQHLLAAFSLRVDLGHCPSLLLDPARERPAVSGSSTSRRPASHPGPSSGCLGLLLGDGVDRTRARAAITPLSAHDAASAGELMLPHHLAISSSLLGILRQRHQPGRRVR